MTNTIRKLTRATLPLALMFAAACADTTAPEPHEMNTQAALADYAALDAMLDSDALRSFRMTATAIQDASLGGTTEAAGMSSVRVPLISDANRGKTYVYDAENDRWVIDPALTDAPATGVRFIMYEPAGAKPDPTKPIGHADLIDLGDTAEGIALRLVAVEGETTLLDYHTTISGAEGSGRVTVDGFIRNANDQLDFEIDVRGQNANGVDRGDITFDIGIAAREFRVTGDVHGEKHAGSELGTVDLAVRHGTDSFRVDVENQDAQLSGFIDLNDAPFVTVSGVEQHPVFTTPSGDPITGAHALVLWRVFDVSEDVFDLFEDLVEPIAGLVIIAIIL